MIFFAMADALYAGTARKEKTAPGFELFFSGQLINGNIMEEVYSGSNSSRLNWSIQNIFAVKVETALSLHGFFLSAFISSGYDKTSGTVSDIDRLSDGTVTRESYHRCRIAGYMTFGLFAGFEIPSFNGITIAPYAGSKRLNTAFEAFDGYALSPEGVSYPIEGTLIRYEQEFTIPLFGLRVDKTLHGFCDAGIIAEYGPYVFCSAVDRHYSTMTTYYDTLRGGAFLSGELYFQIRLISPLTIKGSCGYEKLFTVRGDTRSLNNSTGEETMTYSDSAGTSGSAWSLSVSAGISY